MIACMGRLGARESSERQMGRCARILAGVYVPPYMVCVAQVWRPKDRVSWTRTGKLGACSFNGETVTTESRSRSIRGLSAAFASARSRARVLSVGERGNPVGLLAIAWARDIGSRIEQ